MDTQQNTFEMSINPCTFLPNKIKQLTILDFTHINWLYFISAASVIFQLCDLINSFNKCRSRTAATPHPHLRLNFLVVFFCKFCLHNMHILLVYSTYLFYSILSLSLLWTFTGGGLQFRRISAVAQKYSDALPCFSHDIHAMLSINCKYISFNPNVPCLNVILTNYMQNFTFC